MFPRSLECGQQSACRRPVPGSEFKIPRSETGERLPLFPLFHLFRLLRLMVSREGGLAFRAGERRWEMD